MKKDIEWLKEETSAVLRGVFNNHALNYIDYIEVKGQLERLFDQLDEPEVLTKEWIDENEVFIFDLDDDCEIRYVPSLKLRHLLVPEQEDMFNGEEPDEGEVYFAVGLGGAVEVSSASSIDEAIERLVEYETNYNILKKPAIPEFVADYIDWCKEEGISLGVTFHSALNGDLDEPLQSWIRKSQEELIKAWLAYPNIEVEEEQKYIVVLGKSIYNTTTYGQIGEVNGEKIMLSIYASKEDIINPNKYTKQEILKVKDGEDIFERYAVKVEELENE